MSIIKNKIEIFVAVVLAVVFGISVIVFLKKIEVKTETIKVARAVENLEAPRVLKVGDIVMEYVPRGLVPEGAIRNADKLVGLVLTHNIIKGGWFSEYDLVYSRDPNSDGTILPGGSLGLVLPANWFVGAMPRVKPHDFVFIYAATQNKKDGPVGKSGLMLANLLVVRVETQKDLTPSSILVAVSGAEAETLASARANSVPMILVVGAAEGGIVSYSAH